MSFPILAHLQTALTLRWFGRDTARWAGRLASNSTSGPRAPHNRHRIFSTRYFSPIPELGYGFLHGIGSGPRASCWPAAAQRPIWCWRIESIHALGGAWQTAPGELLAGGGATPNMVLANRINSCLYAAVASPVC